MVSFALAIELAIELAISRIVSAMAAMTMEQVHQRTGQQQEVTPVASNMFPVLAQQIEAPDRDDHQRRRLEWQP